MANSLGQNAESIRLFERLIELDPLNLSSLKALGSGYLKAERFDDAIATYNRVVAIAPEYPNIFSSISFAYLAKGEPERALAEFEKSKGSQVNVLLQSNIQFSLGNVVKAQAIFNKFLESPSDGDVMRIARYYAFRGENDAAFEWLERAFELNDPELAYILGSYVLQNLASDPRYPVFLEKLGLLEYWKAMPPEIGGPSH